MDSRRALFRKILSMSTKYSIVSALVFALVLSGFSGIASAATKDTKKKEGKKPAVTLVSYSAVQKTEEQKKDDNKKKKEQKLAATTASNAFLVAETKKKDDKKKSPEGSIDQVVSLSSSSLSSLAYQPTQWKPTSYMGMGRHCSNHSGNTRGYTPMIG